MSKFTFKVREVFSRHVVLFFYSITQFTKSSFPLTKSAPFCRRLLFYKQFKRVVAYVNGCKTELLFCKWNFKTYHLVRHWIIFCCNNCVNRSNDKKFVGYPTRYFLISYHWKKPPILLNSCNFCNDVANNELFHVSRCNSTRFSLCSPNYHFVA